MQKLFYLAEDGFAVPVLYYPSKIKNAPLIIEIHGGGFFAGCAEDDMQMDLDMVSAFGVNVASIDYRYAPRALYPTATKDCACAVKGLLDDEGLDFDKSKVVLLGSSAGANAATGVCYLLKGDKRIKGQVLVYPWLDAKNHKRKVAPFGFLNIQMLSMTKKYMPNKAVRSEFLASPDLGDIGAVSGMPPTFIVTAGIDTLREDGERYYKLLKNACVPCTIFNVERGRHGYFECIPNGHMKSWWWLTKKWYREQEDAYALTLQKIGEFLKEIL